MNVLMPHLHSFNPDRLVIFGLVMYVIALTKRTQQGEATNKELVERIQQGEANNKELVERIQQGEANNMKSAERIATMATEIQQLQESKEQSKKDNKSKATADKKRADNLDKTLKTKKKEHTSLVNELSTAKSAKDKALANNEKLKDDVNTLKDDVAELKATVDRIELYFDGRDCAKYTETLHAKKIARRLGLPSDVIRKVKFVSDVTDYLGNNSSHLPANQPNATYPRNVIELEAISDVYSAVKYDGDYKAHGFRPKDVLQAMNLLSDRMTAANVSQAAIDEMMGFKQKVTAARDKDATKFRDAERQALHPHN